MKGVNAYKTVLIGLDGATYSILDPLIEQGVMPHLGALLRRGTRAILRSTNHPLTPPAWTALMTGRTPGVHGVYDFVRVDHAGHEPSYTLATSADVKSETIWSFADKHGLRVTSLNFPCMFPANDVNGFIIPGYVPWSYLARAVRPRNLYQRLKEMGGFNPRELSTDWEHERKAVQGLSEDQLDEWVRFHIVREKRWFEILMMLMKNEPCELTGVLFDGVDRLQHLCYHLIDPATAHKFNSPDAQRARELCIQYFKDLDGYIASIIAEAGPDAHIIMASDHGFTRAGENIFYVNTWLEQNGYLRWADGVEADSSGRVALDGNDELGQMFDWSRTKVFAFTSSSNGIFIRRAKEPGDVGVAPEEYESFRAKLKDRLLAFKNPATGERVVTDVLFAEDAFPGPHSDKAPDLTLKLADHGFQSVLRAATPLQPRRTEYGTHHPDGVFITAGPGVCQGKVLLTPLSICDVAATVLYDLGLPIPEDMEGKVPLTAYESDYAAANPVRFGPPSDAGDAVSLEQLPPEAEAEIRERLKALGYI
jgi:predicted AlkP superfamily phosphohydrolase/phosphomutase